MNAITANRLGRALLVVLSAGVIVYVLGVVVFGVADLVAQLSAHDIRLTMYWAPGEFSYSDDGNGHSGVKIAGVGGAAETVITGISGSVVALHVVSTVVGMLTQLALGVLAYRMLLRLRAGTPFGNAAWREVAVSSVVVLGLGIASQLLAWWDRVAVNMQSGGIMFSNAFVFEPLTVTIGLTLALIAVAFRTGERMQRDTEGLV
jgi:hypothetical protein